MASLTRWTWVWVNSGSWWWTGRPSVLQFMESCSNSWSRKESDMTERLKWTELMGVARAMQPKACIKVLSTKVWRSSHAQQFRTGILETDRLDLSHHLLGTWPRASYPISLSFHFLSFFVSFRPSHKACGILVPQPEIEPQPPETEAWSLNHWTTREVSIFSHFQWGQHRHLPYCLRIIVRNQLMCTNWFDQCLPHGKC